MRIESVMAATAATVENGMLNVTGGGWEYYQAPEFPARLAGVVCGILVPADDEAGGMATIDVEVGDTDGHIESATGSFPLVTIRSIGLDRSPMREPFAVEFDVVVDAPTIAQIRLSCGGAILGTLEFAVIPQT